MLLSAALHSRNTELAQPSGFTEMQTEAQGEAGLAKGHAPGVGPCIPQASTLEMEGYIPEGL